MIFSQQNTLTRSRWAPTPSGFLHIGNAFNFLITWLLTRDKGGSIRLRIDDLDAARARDEYIEDIFQTLHWLGLEWEEGPTTVAQQKAQFSQRHRLHHYHTALKTLRDSGELFACDCSRKKIQTDSQDGQYPGTCLGRGLSLQTDGCAWRLITPPDSQINWIDGWQGNTEINIWNQIRYPVLRRKDQLPAYQLASVVDDELYRTNLIIRGVDLINSTGLQLFLANKLQLATFSNASFWHHPLLRKADGNKLSKSKGALAIRSLREKGNGKKHVFQSFARAMNWPEMPDDAVSLLEVFSIHKSFPRQFGYLTFPS